MLKYYLFRFFKSGRCWLRIFNPLRKLHFVKCSCPHSVYKYYCCASRTTSINKKNANSFQYPLRNRLSPLNARGKVFLRIWIWTGLLVNKAYQNLYLKCLIFSSSTWCIWSWTTAGDKGRFRPCMFVYIESLLQLQ